MSKPYTVIGYWNDEDEPVSVGVIEGEHPVHGGAGATEGGDWAMTVEADSPEDAEGLALGEMRATLSEDGDDEDDDPVSYAIGDKVVWTDPDGGARSVGTVTKVNGDVHLLAMDAGGETETLAHELKAHTEGDAQ